MWRVLNQVGVFMVLSDPMGERGGLWASSLPLRRCWREVGMDQVRVNWRKAIAAHVVTDIRRDDPEKQLVMLVWSHPNPLCEEKYVERYSLWGTSDAISDIFKTFFYSKMGMFNSAIIFKQRLYLWVVKPVYLSPWKGLRKAFKIL